VTPSETQTEAAPAARSPEDGGRTAERGRFRQAGARATRYARENPMLVIFIALGLVARIVFWAVTDRKLDDALITIKFDKNLADGFGLVHNLGDGHVHGFTSALSVLVPLPGELIYHGGGLLLIRLVSLACFVLAAVYANRIAGQLNVGRWPLAFALAYLALDQNQVFFGVAGMETQIAVAVLFGALYYVLVEDYTKSGIALGLAVLARPDFVLLVAPAYVFLIARDPRRALRAGALTAAVLVPWIVFTTIYYGSPIPNTITAKSLAFAQDFPALTHVGAWIDFIRHQITLNQGDWTLFAPFFEAAFIVKSPLAYGVAKAIAVLVALLAVTGAASTFKRWSWLPAIAYLALFVVYKVLYVTVGYFEWYGTPAAALLIFMAAVGLDRVTKWLAAATRGRFTPAEIVAVPAILLAFIYAMALPYRTAVEEQVQRDIENKVRQPLGEYLGQVTGPGDTITSESSGYVGYDTNATLYDYPGLESTTVVDALRKAKDSGHPVLPVVGNVPLLHPEWVVLRPNEARLFLQWYPEDARQYEVVRRFSVPGGQDPICVQGFCQRNIDRDFIVFRKRT
jgi:hypothetical protein